MKTGKICARLREIMIKRQCGITQPSNRLQRLLDLEPLCRPSRYKTVQYVPSELPHIELERENGDEALERVLCVFNIPSLLVLAACV